MNSAICSSRPQSATHGLTAAAGLLGFIAATAILRVSHPFGDNLVHSVLFIIVMTAGFIFVVDLSWQKVHLRPTTGLDFSYDSPSFSRTLIKFTGLLGSMGFIAFLYWLFPEYHNKFFGPFYEMLRLILPLWLVLAIPYFFFIDRKMREPHDGYWHMGMLVLFRWNALDGRILGQHILSWLIKGYFFSMMFVLTCMDLSRFLEFNFERLTAYKYWVVFLYDYLYFIDVALVTMGYLMAFRITDTHLRSAEPTMLGWVVTLICYEPFGGFIFSRFLAYKTGFGWGTWLDNRMDSTPSLMMIWGSAILFLSVIYAWATIIFGARFSNLTHRGIITNGPFRWTKHPSYIAKNISWWLISVPFVSPGTPDENLRLCLLLLGVNLVYVMRAKTEEWHLSRDPAYVQYALWMEQHGMFRFLKYIPVLRYLSYRPPKQAVSTASA